ncbi:MAG: gamma-glutamyl-gamma-aminobutyrate hydrolase family protein [Terriglobales bacterium]
MRPRIAIPVPHSESDYAQRALPPYLKAIEQAGGEPVVIALDLPNAEIARTATQCDAVLLPGSRADIDPEKYGAPRDPRTAPADPARDNLDELLLQDAFNMRKPIFGICYGVQSLNVWRTGTLLQHVENHSPGRDVVQAHKVRVERSSEFARIVGVTGDMWVNSSHHQAVDAPGDGLKVVARADDGTIEAVEGVALAHYVIAVQWHPERTVEVDEPSRRLFSAFVCAARAWHEHAQSSAPDYESLRR